MAPDRQPHDLTEDSLLRSGADVPAVSEHRETKKHRAKNDAEHQFGAFRARYPGLLKERHAVGDRLDAGERAAARRKRLQDQEHRDDLEAVRREQRASRLWLREARGDG